MNLTSDTHTPCQDHDPDLWFPDHKTGQAVHRGGRYLTARDVCLSCPWARDCFQLALDHRERFGIWGGVEFTSPHNPDKLRATFNLIHGQEA